MSIIYNGNIRHMVTAIRNTFTGFDPIQAMAYNYDQLNRISSATCFRNIDVNGNQWQNTSPLPNYGYNEEYTYDKNGNILSLLRAGNSTTPSMDNLTYHYAYKKNRLSYVTDLVSSLNYPTDIDNQSANNYVFDSIGNLISDIQEALSIDWNVYGKIKKVTKLQTNTHLDFEYDAGGNRIEKCIKDTMHTRYTLDAQGNIMAVYTSETRRRSFATQTSTLSMKRQLIQELYNNMPTTLINDIITPCLNDIGAIGLIIYYLQLPNINTACSLIINNVKSQEEFGYLLDIVTRAHNYKPDVNGLYLLRTNFTDRYSLSELPIYGSSRLGMIQADTIIDSLEYNAALNPFNSMYFSRNYTMYYPLYQTVTDTLTVDRSRGKRKYELANHLGNVLAVVSDRKLPYDINSDLIVDYFEPDTRSATDYFPFGSAMPGRIYSANNYRFGFNGKEMDNEISGFGNLYDYGFRVYNPRLGKFFSIDPLTKNFAMLTPYQFAANTPIRAIDLDGLEPVEVGKNNPFLVIVVLGRNGGPYGDDIQNGNTQYQNLPAGKQNDDGLSLVNQLTSEFATVATFAGSDDKQTANDIYQTIKNYRTTNPEGKIAIIGHSVGAANAMDAALMVGKDNDIANKTIDLLVTMEPAIVENNGTPIVKTLSNNVKNIINYTSFSSLLSGGAAEASGNSQSVGNFTLGKGTNHGNMDNTLLPAVGAILKLLSKGVDPVKVAGKIDYNNLKIYDNGSRYPKASGGTSN